MSSPARRRASVTRPHYVSLEDWLNVNGSIQARFVQGDAYIASHSWTSGEDTKTTETFGESVMGNDAQADITVFLNKDAGVWEADPGQRKARWSRSASVCQYVISSAVEVVGRAGEQGNHPEWIHALCTYMKSVNV
jgi:hypothetical protein